ncbi:MAG: 5-methylcytosine-specific restriction enzyme [Mycobacterium sp.]|jgi:hypothetical protein|nr:5-methylcytosine-specific restriction enzyme [Mycobacterium sp.]
MARMHVCSCIGCPAHDGTCPELSTARRCPDCQAHAEQRRGSRQARGYDAQHDRLRARWKPKVDAGLVDCHAEVCLLPQRRIWLGMEWQLGHTPDRKAYRGPEHKPCNEAEGGRMSHGG